MFFSYAHELSHISFSACRPHIIHIKKREVVNLNILSNVTIRAHVYFLSRRDTDKVFLNESYIITYIHERVINTHISSFDSLKV